MDILIHREESGNLEYKASLIRKAAHDEIIEEELDMDFDDAYFKFCDLKNKQAIPIVIDDELVFNDILSKAGGEDGLKGYDFKKQFSFAGLINNVERDLKNGAFADKTKKVCLYNRRA